MSSIFAKLLSFLLLLSLSSNCSGIRDEEDQKPTQYACLMSCTAKRDEQQHQIQLAFNHSYGKVSPVDLDAYYQNYAAPRHLTSKNLPILCTVTNYETAFSGKLNELYRRTKVTVLCALPAKAKATMENESSTSYMSRHIYDITRQIASLIGNYQWLKPGAVVYGEEVDRDRVSDLDIVTFNLSSSQPKQNFGGTIQMAATLSFLTSRPVQHYFPELRIAVVIRSVPRQFANISHDENHEETQITGFWIDIFKAATAMMPINITYKLVPFYGSDDELVKEVARKTFDAAIGLTVTRDEQCQLVEFSYPYFEVGPILVMKKNPELNQVFSFLVPFTNEMWLTMASMTAFTAFVIWLVEHRTIGKESGGLPSRQTGAIFWFPFATLFYGAHRESPRNSLTYFVLAPWLFLVLIVTSTYTAGFTSMITSSETDQSSCLDVENLKKTNAVVGCDEDSAICSFLVEVIGFPRKNIKHIPQSSMDDYAKALSSENIKAAFFLAPYADVFLAKYCKDFKGWSPVRNLRASAFVFPRDSFFTSKMSEAMHQLIQSGEFKRMKQDMLAFSDCSRSTIDRTIKRGIGPGPFSGLFILSGGASAIALLIIVVRMMKKRWESFIQGILMGKGLWVWLTALLSQNRRRNELELSRISSTSQTQLSSS